MSSAVCCAPSRYPGQPLQAKIDEERVRHEQEEQPRAEQEKAKRAMLAEIAESFEVKVGGMTHSLEAAARQMETAARSMSSTAEQTSQQAAIIAERSEATSENVNTMASANWRSLRRQRTFES